ncbi:MAG: recombination protein O N-terminal domain-containing protein, partial [Clostridia bacterium]|nr:recombination protein O N-terminal domain-containing protein [Clostridia bacterium]
MRFTTDALVIKEMKVGESDRLVTLLTKEYGVIKAFAAGAKNIKSKKAAATGLLSYSSVTILKKN